MSIRNILLATIGLAWGVLASASAAEFVMVAEGDRNVAPALLRVVASDTALHADMPTEHRIDLDQDGVTDLCVEVVTTMTNTVSSGIETVTTLRVKGRIGVELGMSGPLGAGDIIRRGDQYFRSVSLARFQGNEKVKIFFGEWSQTPDEMTGILPVRMRGDEGMHLGFLSLRLDGYGNVQDLSYAISLQPLQALAVPELSVSSIDVAPRRDGGHPLRAEPVTRMAMN